MTLLFALLACATSNPVEPPVAEAPEAVEAPAAPEVAEAPAATPLSDDAVHYGAPFTLEEITPASALLDDPAAFTGKTVRVQGRVAEVCQKAGCWMVIAEGDKSMRVLMKDHDFAVDKQGSGRNCQVEGVVTTRELDPEFVEHLASESEHPEDMPEKKAEGNVVYELTATGVRMAKAGA
ncbi:MAG: DUF4920 domain-containing protein [Alphaproteobacteria bacterium]|nr:DUF4920 domain-containing protein [Alphaproteobacteria bacterium]